jgi:hypothetical protein
VYVIIGNIPDREVWCVINIYVNFLGGITLNFAFMELNVALNVVLFSGWIKHRKAQIQEAIVRCKIRIDQDGFRHEKKNIGKNNLII